MCMSEMREEEHWAACFALVFTMSHNNSLVLLKTSGGRINSMDAAKETAECTVLAVL